MGRTGSIDRSDQTRYPRPTTTTESTPDGPPATQKKLGKRGAAHFWSAAEYAERSGAGLYVSPSPPQFAANADQEAVACRTPVCAAWVDEKGSATSDP